MENYFITVGKGKDKLCYLKNDTFGISESFIIDAKEYNTPVKLYRSIRECIKVYKKLGEPADPGIVRNTIYGAGGLRILSEKRDRQINGELITIEYTHPCHACVQLHAEEVLDMDYMCGSCFKRSGRT